MKKTILLASFIALFAPFTITLAKNAVDPSCAKLVPTPYPVSGEYVCYLSAENCTQPAMYQVKWKDGSSSTSRCVYPHQGYWFKAINVPYGKIVAAYPCQ